MIKNTNRKVSNSSKNLLLFSLLAFFSVFLLTSLVYSAPYGYGDSSKPTLKAPTSTSSTINNVNNTYINQTIVNGSGGTPGGQVQSVQFNNGSSFSGDGNLTYNAVNQTLKSTTLDGLNYINSQEYSVLFNQPISLRNYNINSEKNNNHRTNIGSDYKDVVPLRVGDNPFAINPNTNLTKRDINVSVTTCFPSFIGYSGDVPYKISKIKYTNSSTSCYIGKCGSGVRIYSAESSTISGVGRDLTALIPNGAYWFDNYNDEDGNLTFEKITGSNIGNIANIDNLQFENATNGETKTSFSNAVSAGWIVNDVSTYGFDFDSFSCGYIRKSSGVLSDLNTWTGYFIRGKAPNINMIINSSNATGKLFGGEGFFYDNLTVLDSVMTDNLRYTNGSAYSFGGGSGTFDNTNLAYRNKSNVFFGMQNISNAGNFSATSNAKYALLTTGDFGGGIGMLDGSKSVGIWSSDGGTTLNFGINNSGGGFATQDIPLKINTGKVTITGQLPLSNAGGSFNPGSNVNGILALSGDYGGGITFLDTASTGMWVDNSGQTFHLAVGRTGNFGTLDDIKITNGNVNISRGNTTTKKLEVDLGLFRSGSDAQDILGTPTEVSAFIDTYGDKDHLKPSLRFRQSNVPSIRWWDMILKDNVNFGPAMQFLNNESGTLYYGLFHSYHGETGVGQWESLASNIVLDKWNIIAHRQAVPQGISIYDDNSGGNKRIAVQFTSNTTIGRTLTESQILAHDFDLDIASRGSGGTPSNINLWTGNSTMLNKNAVLDGAGNFNITGNYTVRGNIGVTQTYTLECDSVLSLGVLTNKYQNFTYAGGILVGNTTCA